VPFFFLAKAFLTNALPVARTDRALCLLRGRAAGFPRHRSPWISAL